jgi:hypothetical protein
MSSGADAVSQSPTYQNKKIIAVRLLKAFKKKLLHKFIKD